LKAKTAARLETDPNATCLNRPSVCGLAIYAAAKGFYWASAAQAGRQGWHSHFIAVVTYYRKADIAM
jgi:hypothetical protein